MADEDSPSPSVGPSYPFETVTIRIGGLRKKLSPETYLDRTFSHVVRLPSQMAFSELGRFLLETLPSKFPLWDMGFSHR